METIPETEPILIKSIVNGLIATAILWLFWMPFIIILARPLVNSQIKVGLCRLAMQISEQTKSAQQLNSFLLQFLQGLIQLNILTHKQVDSLYKTYSSIPVGNDQTADNILNMNFQEMIDENIPLTIIFIIFSILIIGITIFSAYFLCNFYNINWYNILKFNSVMALIIIIIESLFFIFVAMQYVPFDIPLIISQIKYKLETYLDTITSNERSCTINDFVQQNNYFISNWACSTNHGCSYYYDLSEAKRACIATPECAAITTGGGYTSAYVLASSSVRSWSNISNSTGTSWLFNNCTK